MRTIIALFLFSIITSCATQKRCSEKWPAVITPIDTITVTQVKDTTIYKDTIITVTIPADTIIDSIFIEKGIYNDPAYISDTARAETDLATAAAWVKHSQVILKLEQKQTDIFIKLDSAIKQRDRYRKELMEIKQIHQVPVYKPTRWHVFTGAAFWILSAIVLLYLVLTFLVLRR